MAPASALQFNFRLSLIIISDSLKFSDKERVLGLLEFGLCNIQGFGSFQPPKSSQKQQPKYCAYIRNY